jgi:CPA1 family monovalent cation:H+ antiporter
MLAFFAILISTSAIFGYINHKWLKLPGTIGVMLISVVFGISLKLGENVIPDFIFPIRTFLTEIDFSAFVLDFILCFLLFAGALHVRVNELKDAKATVFSYSTIGVIISTLIIGVLTKFTVNMFGTELPWLVCFLFGALISPTDPIAVIGILSKYNVPKKLKTEIIGESLFNDGVGEVVFAIIFSLIARTDGSFGWTDVFKIIGMEVIGGLGIGFLIGYLGYVLLKSIDHYQTEILITLAIVTGGYSIASGIHSSGPLAMVVAGLIIGNKGKAVAMSDITAEYVDKFWELIDEICNTILFVLIGLEIFLIPFDLKYLLIGLILIAVSLLARYISLVPAFYIFNKSNVRKSLDLAVLTWGGLRGGISVALVLSLTNKVENSSLLIVCTYCIVLFSILCQGLTIKRLLAKY